MRNAENGIERRAWGIGQGAESMGNRAWRVEQDDLKPEYLSSVFCSLTSGVWLRTRRRLIGRDYAAAKDAENEKGPMHAI
jgi:hypothetical protein